MKEIIKNIGNAFIYVAVAGTVFALLFKGIVIGDQRGILQITGHTASEMLQEKQTSSASEQAVKQLQSRQRPEVTASEVACGTAYAVTDVIHAVDADGAPADVTILAIKDRDGLDVMEHVYDGTQLLFNTVGAYRIKVRAEDALGVCHICTLYVMCNN